MEQTSKSAWLALRYGLAYAALATFAIWGAGVLWLEPGALSPDKPGMWYQWQLREATVWTRVSAWGFYLAHQVGFWWLIWLAQQVRPAYSDRLTVYNKAALALNGSFIAIHLLQTQIWYDGLAQDVPEWTSQWSVILMLIAILMIENRRRGMLFGRKSAWVDRPYDIVKRYHGYYFSWAIVYTFWYHPMEYTSGHLLGFTYMFLLLLQGSLFFTRVHTNKYWKLVQEVAVIVHALIVAIMNGDSWPMFFFGFAGVFVICQMHGLGWSLRRRWIVGSLYLAAYVGIYAIRGWDRAPEVILVSGTLWFSAFILAGLLIGAGRLLGHEVRSEYSKKLMQNKA